LEVLETRNLMATVLKTGHVHLQMNFSNGKWQPFEVENTSNGNTYAPEDVIIFVDPAQKTTQPAGWNFIGAGDGNPYWDMDSSSSSPFVSLSINTDQIPSGTFGVYQPLDPRVTFAGEWIKLEMRKVEGPGFVSNWQNGQPPSAWWMSSHDGGRTLPAVFYIEPGGHTHLHWGFTKVGVYKVTFEASAFVGGSGLPVYSDDVTLRFGVETTRRPQNPIPPSPPRLFQAGMLSEGTSDAPIAEASRGKSAEITNGDSSKVEAKPIRSLARVAAARYDAAYENLNVDRVFEVF
jgi:surface-anchored protein